LKERQRERTSDWGEKGGIGRGMGRERRGRERAVSGSEEKLVVFEGDNKLSGGICRQPIKGKPCTWRNFPHG
jgi:hypothetical protein